MNRLKAFLMHGYFPIQLPPGFTTADFARKYKKFEAVWNANDPQPSEPERFSVARSSYNRRITSILNPVPFYYLAKVVNEYWPKIQNHFSRSRFSFSRPKLCPGIRAIRINRFSDIHDHRILASAGYRYALITDISRFFPTIYTHSIPWAVHGKAAAKRHRSLSPTYYGNILDAASRRAQDGQTLGLPVGPDTSHVIAEIIGTAMDIEIRDRLGGWPRGFRYVDDFYLFFNSRQDAENALPAIVKAATLYELQINPQKTRIIETREMVEESWKYKLKGLPISSGRSHQRDQIHAFFESLLALERSYKDESVVKYGLKVISSKIIKKSNWTEFEAYLLHCGFAYPNSLQVIASILSTYSSHGYPLDRRALGRFCNAIVSSHARLDDHSEVAWADPFFAELLSKGVSFFNDSIRLPPIFTPKEPGSFDSSLFESDLSVESLLEFDEADEEYFDRDSEDEEEQDEDESDSESGTEAANNPFGVEF